MDKMETLRVSSYVIPIKLESNKLKYMLIHGYTGAIDLVTERIALKLIQHDKIDSKLFSSNTLNTLIERGYITTKSKEEEDNHVARIAQALHKKAEILYKTFTWIVTYNCNFRCPYCFERRDTKNAKHYISFTKEQVNKTFEAMQMIEPRMQLQNHIITLYGGEPLLKENKDIVTYIVKEGQKRGYKFHAVTNGYDLDCYTDLLSPDLICQIQITIDGTKDFHNQKRKHFQDANSFDKIISNLKLILQNNIDVNIHIRVNTDNSNFDDFIALKSYFKEIGFWEHKNFSIYSALISDNDSISQEDKKDISILSTTDYIQKHISTGTISFCNGYSTIYKNIHNAIYNKKPVSLKATYCSAQTGGYVFSPFGEIYPCWEIVGNKNFLIGILLKKSIKWDYKKLHNWRSLNVCSSTCKHCKYALLCGGGCPTMKNNHCIYFQETLKNAANNVYRQVCVDMFNLINF